MDRYYDEVRGWGDIVMVSKNYIIVHFDADPWEYVQIPTWEEKKGE